MAYVLEVTAIIVGSGVLIVLGIHFGSRWIKPL